MNITRWLRLISWCAVAAWALGIVVLSSLSGSQVEEMNVVQLWDKAAHFAAFAVGAALLALALQVSTVWPARRLFLVSFAAISLFGATDEWHQLYTPKRSGADFGDWLADSLGACCGAAAITFLHARHRPKNRPASAGA